MNFSIRKGMVRAVLLMIICGLLLGLFSATRYLLGPYFPDIVFPDITTLMMYLTPMALGVSVMTYVSIRGREALILSRKHEKELEDSRGRFEYLYMSSPVPYININADGVIFMVNRAAMRLFDAREEKILGTSLYDRLTHSNDTRLSILVHQLQNQITISDTEVQFKTNEGDIKWVLLSAFADGLNGEVLVSLMDITRQKEIDIAKTEFVTLASHQLRTPIAAVRWNLELLQATEKDLTAAQELYYYKVNRNVERLASLVNDFLHVSKLELGTFASSQQEVVLSQFINNTVEEFDKSIQDKNLTIETSFDPEELKAELDPRLFRIILDNLVSNAVKYTRTSGTIRIGYQTSKTHVTLTIADNGIGIPPNEIGNMFNRFYRGSNAEKQHAEGTGLGLYIIKKAVKMMSGDVTVESILDSGTTFTLKFPL
jgi:two-component system, OmpR family, phosphate regulon sensor histidine kinase PhoR